MPLTESAKDMLEKFKKQYGAEKGESFFYAYLNENPELKRKVEGARTVVAAEAPELSEEEQFTSVPTFKRQHEFPALEPRLDGLLDHTLKNHPEVEEAVKPSVELLRACLHSPNARTYMDALSAVRELAEHLNYPELINGLTLILMTPELVGYMQSRRAAVSFNPVPAVKAALMENRISDITLAVCAPDAVLSKVASANLLAIVNKHFNTLDFPAEVTVDGTSADTMYITALCKSGGLDLNDIDNRRVVVAGELEVLLGIRPEVAVVNHEFNTAQMRVTAAYNTILRVAEVAERSDATKAIKTQAKADAKNTFEVDKEFQQALIQLVAGNDVKGAHTMAMTKAEERIASYEAQPESLAVYPDFRMVYTTEFIGGVLELATKRQQDFVQPAPTPMQYEPASAAVLPVEIK